MSTNHEHDGEDEGRSARRTAHTLGQTLGAEEAEVAAELAASPQARQELEAVEALAARLKEAARAAPRPEPSPALREAIERRLAELEPAAGRAAGPGAARPWWRGRLMALALSAACLAALAVPIAWSMHWFGTRKVSEVARQAAAPGTALSPADQSKTTTKQPAREAGFNMSGGVGGGDTLMAAYGHGAFQATEISPLNMRSGSTGGALIELQNTGMVIDDVRDSSYVHYSGGVATPLTGWAAINQAITDGNASAFDLGKNTSPGRLMYGPGANSDSGLVGNITLDEQNLSAQPTEGLAKVHLTYNIANMGWAGTGQPTEDLTKAGMGSLVLNGSNIFTADTTINFGTLQLRNGEGIVGHGDHNVTLFTENNSQPGGDWAFDAGKKTSTGSALWVVRTRRRGDRTLPEGPGNQQCKQSRRNGLASPGC